MDGFRIRVGWGAGTTMNNFPSVLAPQVRRRRQWLCRTREFRSGLGEEDTSAKVYGRCEEGVEAVRSRSGTE